MSLESAQEIMVLDHQPILHEPDLDNDSVVQDRLRELETEEYFIEKLKKQREKVQILKVEFQEQEKALQRQQAQLAEWQRENDQLKQLVELHIGKEKQMEVELADREARLSDYQRKYERIIMENRRLKESCEQYKESLRVSAEKLTEQEGIFTKNFESIRSETKALEREAGLLKDKFKDKAVESNELYRSLQLAEKMILRMQQEMARQEQQFQFTLEEYTRKNQSMEKEITGLLRQTEQQKTKVASQLKLISDYQDQQVRYQQQISELEHALESKDATNRKLQQDIRVCLEQIKSLQVELDKRQSQLRGVSQKKKATRQYDSMRKELVSVRDRQAEHLDQLIEALNSRRRPAH